MAKIGRPINWPSPKTPFSKRLQCIIPKEGLEKISLKYFGGVSKETVKRYFSGDSEPPVSVIFDLCDTIGCDIKYLVRGIADEKPAQNAVRVIHALPDTVVECKSMPIVGLAAADNKDASRAELYAPENIEEFEAIKPHYRLIQIVGNSMSPVVLDKQFVMIGSEIPPNAAIKKSGWIGVAQVDCENAEYPEVIARDCTCTFCKRIFPVDDGSEMLIFTSINDAECGPFTVMRRNVMHLWPIRGVLFAGQGTAPED